MTACCGVTLVVYDLKVSGKVLQTNFDTMYRAQLSKTARTTPLARLYCMRAPGMTQEFGGHLERSYL